MLTIEEILKATGGRLHSGEGKQTISGVSIDSRTIKEGDLFFAIKGDKFDGHDFLNDVIKKGVTCLVVQEGHLMTNSLIPGAHTGCAVITVADTMLALQETAGYYRDKFSIPVIGITGSNGKTTTKEMLWNILSCRMSVLKNEGNMNNHIGVPLTLLKLNQSHQMAVIEMGISDKGELTRLCQITKPTSAVITNIGPSHLEKLGRIENVAEAKGEILDFIKPEGVSVLNMDDTFFDVFKAKSAGKVISFGMSSSSDVYTEYTDNSPNFKSLDNTTFTLICPLGKSEIKLNVIGIHNLYNALSAAAAAYGLGVPLDNIKQGLEKFTPVKMRSTIEKVGGIFIINDTYNANPASMVAAIDMLKNIKEGKQKFVVLGDMLELGENTERAHHDLGKYIGNAGIDGLIAVGELAAYIADGAAAAGMDENRILTFNDYAETLDKITQWLNRGDVLLVKGSRGMKMERIVEGLKETLN